MARGKKSSPELIYKVMASYATTRNLRETSRELNVPLPTVKCLVDANKDKPEFIQLQTEKAKEFSEKASEIIQKGLLLLDRRFSRALQKEEELDVLIEAIFDSEKTEISQDEKKRLVDKIKALQLHDVKAITTAIGTLYDKRALENGSSTEKMTVEIKLPPDVDEYAG